MEKDQPGEAGGDLPKMAVMNVQLRQHFLKRLIAYEVAAMQDNIPLRKRALEGEYRLETPFAQPPPSPYPVKKVMSKPQRRLKDTTVVVVGPVSAHNPTEAEVEVLTADIRNNFAKAATTDMVDMDPDEAELRQLWRELEEQQDTWTSHGDHYLVWERSESKHYIARNDRALAKVLRLNYNAGDNMVGIVLVASDHMLGHP